MKPGILIDIPGFGSRHVHAAVSDYSGTLSCGGRLSEGVPQRLREMSGLVDVHILTSDTFGTAQDELKGLPLLLEVLGHDNHDIQKRNYVLSRCEPAYTAAFGNGNNDRLLLKAVKDAGGVAVAVDNGEGCAIEAILNANLFIHGASNALDLLLEPSRLKATLRF